MSDDGTTKDDVKLPDGEVGDKVTKLFTEDGKDTSKLYTRASAGCLLTPLQTSSSSLPWAKSVPSTPRRLPSLVR